jgi:transposase
MPDLRMSIQELNWTQPILPLRPGLLVRQTHDYTRHGLTSLYAAPEVASGAVNGACSARHTGADFPPFLKISRRYRTRDLHVILDNSATHKTPAEVQAWLLAHPRVHCHFTPTGASWLNMVKAWFSILTRKSVRRGSFDTASVATGHSPRRRGKSRRAVKPLMRRTVLHVDHCS